MTCLLHAVGVSRAVTELVVGPRKRSPAAMILRVPRGRAWLLVIDGPRSNPQEGAVQG